MQAKAKQREQDLLAQLNAQTESHKQAQHQWESELEVMRRNLEPLNDLVARTEQERDEALESAIENAHKVEEMEKKLAEASSFLSGWKNGNGNGNGNGKASPASKAGRDVLQASRAVLAAGER